MTALGDHSPPEPLSASFLLAPLLTFAFLSFGALGVLSGGMQHGFNRTMVLLLLPALVAGIAAPGYIYALLSYRRWNSSGWLANSWIRTSLVLGVLASASAIVASIPTGVGPILSLWSLVTAVRLLLKFSKRIAEH